MKLYLLLIVSLICLTACTADVGDIRNEKFEVVDKLIDSNAAGTYDVMRDKETGCYYLAYSYGNEISAYYDENGEVMGCGEELDKSNER